MGKEFSNLSTVVVTQKGGSSRGHSTWAHLGRYEPQTALNLRETAFSEHQHTGKAALGRWQESKACYGDHRACRGRRAVRRLQPDPLPSKSP